MTEKTTSTRLSDPSETLWIDWLSPPPHVNFNTALFRALANRRNRCVVFSDRLVVPEVACEVRSAGATRFQQALQVRELLEANRSVPVVLLTYDPLLLPFVRSSPERLLVFEHNTTPDSVLSKHGLWQAMLCRRVMRLAQYPGQCTAIRRLGNRETYIGSPLQPAAPRTADKRPADAPLVLLAPSERAELDRLTPFAASLKGARILAKRPRGASTGTADESNPLCLELRDWLEFVVDGTPVDGVIITTSSRIRGTGWFNDAIAHCTPLVIATDEARDLFTATFPSYPFIFLPDVRGPAELAARLREAVEYDSREYIHQHNDALRQRLERCLSRL